MGNSAPKSSGWRTAPMRTGPMSAEEEAICATFTDNSISTGKYTIISFWAKSLFEQFARLANIYFLVISLMMMVGTYTDLYDSPLTPWTTLGPLSFVLMVSMIKEGLEDIKRHRSDYQINTTITEVMDVISSTKANVVYKKCQWRNVKVGDVVRVANNSDIPADLILLHSSEEQSAAYIETANIDGETNLKVRNAANTGEEGPAFSSEGELVGHGTASIEYEDPNSFIHTFTGTLDFMGKKTPVDQSNVLLRGATLRNTKHALGICIYTGTDTKIIQNSRQSRTKLANIDSTVNTTIYLIMFAQCILSALTMIGFVIFEKRQGKNLWYICVADARDNLPAGTDLYSNCEWESSSDTWGYFFTFFILYNNFIPISLYVTVEMCNYAHAHYIDNDLDMYDEEQDVPSVARTSNLGSDLGQVEYIFSDKTGTLTQNVMRFQKCSVDGVSYSKVQGSGEPMGALSDAAFKKKNAKAYDFIACLGLCHTIVLEKNDETGELEYKAESPDEEALVSAAKELGFSLIERTSSTMKIDLGAGGKKVFKIHAVIPFDSARKRMSVVVENADGSFVVYCKGADNIMLERSRAAESADTMKAHLGSYATEGLRTLVLCKKGLSKGQFGKWMGKWKDAVNKTEGRDEAMASVAALVENDLELVGATAIEDALQDDVSGTISDLMQCGIKLWVLTGDKMETAINIGYSCKLLQDEMTLIKIQTLDDDPETIKLQLQKLAGHFGQVTKLNKNFFEVFNERIERRKTQWRSGIRRVSTMFSVGNRHTNESSMTDDTGDGEEEVEEEVEETILPEGLDLSQLESQDMALIIDGPSLAHVLGDRESERLLLQIACICKAVIACRVSPSQKALIVRLVKKNIYPMPMTLAIGDGANDVGMIQEAQVGVGISGKEGRQAVNSSDFAIAQFKFLRRLVMVHGRWNYRRLCKCILYSFYKNIVLTFMLFFYGFYSGFSGKSLFEDMVYSGYNFFLGMPPLMIGMFDKDMSQRTMLRFKKVYMSGRERMDLNVPTLASWMVQGVIDALVLFFFTFALTGSVGNGMYIFGTTCYSALLLGMLYRAASSTYTWNGVVAFFWVGSGLLYAAIFMPIYSNWYAYSPQFYGTAAEMVAGGDGQAGAFWLVMLLVPTTVLIADLTKKLWRSIFVTTLIDHAMEIDRGITHDAEEMIRVMQGDEDTIKGILRTRGEFADDGMYKWWLAFNSRLPKFKFDRHKLRLLNRKLDDKSKRELGIVDTEVEKGQSGFAYDHVAKGLGVGGTGRGEGESLSLSGRQDSGEDNRDSRGSSGREEGGKGHVRFRNDV